MTKDSAQEGDSGQLAAPTYSERQASEVAYHTACRWPLDTWQLEYSILPKRYREFLEVIDALYEGSRGLEGQRVLECGCGFGILSVFLARKGATVEAFDISENVVDIASRMFRENGVEDSVSIKTGAVETLQYPDESFDLVIGKDILHHVDIESAAKEIRRVLKPKGWAVFSEPTEHNPVRAILSRTYRSLPLIPARGTENEHPLTKSEQEILAATFDGNIKKQALVNLFFSHIVGLVFISPVARRWRVRVRLAVEKLDLTVNSLFPFLKQLTHEKLFLMQKAPEPSEAPCRERREASTG